jgi:hypothetical protein
MALLGTPIAVRSGTILVICISLNPNFCAIRAGPKTLHFSQSEGFACLNSSNSNSCVCRVHT